VTTGSRVVLLVFVAGPALLVLVVLLASGPLGWVAVAALVLAGMLVRALGESTDERTPERASCPDCGAPNDPDAERCGYCDEPLEAAA